MHSSFEGCIIAFNNSATQQGWEREKERACEGGGGDEGREGGGGCLLTQSNSISICQDYPHMSPETANGTYLSKVSLL